MSALKVLFFRRAGPLTVLVFLGGARLLSGNEACPVASKEVSANLEHYVHDAFRFAPITQITLTKVEKVADTCYQKLHFKTVGSSGASEFAFYLSPDLRFLTRDLLDTKVITATEKGKDRVRLSKNSLPVISRQEEIPKLHW